jgi:hypothetical protein
MPSDAILSEVEHLNGVCERLEQLAERTPRLTTALLTIARQRAQCRDSLGCAGSNKAAWP